MCMQLLRKHALCALLVYSVMPVVNSVPMCTLVIKFVCWHFDLYGTYMRMTSVVPIYLYWAPSLDKL